MTHDPTEAALRKWCPRRVRNSIVAPAAPEPVQQPRVGITEDDLMRGYSGTEAALLAWCKDKLAFEQDVKAGKLVGPFTVEDLLEFNRNEIEDLIECGLWREPNGMASLEHLGPPIPPPIDHPIQG